MSADLKKQLDPSEPQESPDPADGAVESDVVAEAPAETSGVLRTCALIGSAAALVVALVAAVWFGTGWVRAAINDAPRADARDTALDAARQAALNMTSMNLDDVPGSLALARSSMTGALLDSADKNKDQAETLAKQTGVGMTSKVLGSALTTLNSENDKASALVVLQVTEHGKDKPPADYRYTWNVDVTKTGEVWKAEQISSLSQPVLLSGGQSQSPQAPPADQPPAAPKPGS
ncbi:hypothetical protein [Nocardia ninae]|uniref:Mce-associated membrane protein n=1 Tax=Nocardia ninae NBRC 108245 TaxID=1210091 RepID=A0A511MMM2_9NOCA|nr:hypothetical protein [Nocardia ninae]GEM41711.1 hypothetical protein NN4_62300 [Nocardia ninae NBRC 108245]